MDYGFHLMEQTQLTRKQRFAAGKVTLSCIVPVYNEAANIVNFITQLTEKLSSYNNPYEIILIDDGSHDQSSELIMQQCNQQIKLLRFSRNFGKELAITAGLEYCRGDFAVLLDSDFQHPLALIDQLIDGWLANNEMVYYYREHRHDESLFKRFSARAYYSVFSKITAINIPANAGDFRLLDRKVITALCHCGDKERYMKGLYAWVGFKTLAIPYVPENRICGDSRWKLKNLFELAITGITSFSNIPLRIWAIVGMGLAAISLCCALYIVIKTIIFGVHLPGYASIMVSIIFFASMQLISIGILGEYIARIFTEVKSRPKYIIAEKVGFDD